MQNKFKTKHGGLTFTEFLLQVHRHKGETEGNNFSEISVALGEEELSRQYQQYIDVDFFDLRKNKVSLKEDQQLPEKSARQLGAMVLSYSKDGARVGFLNPFDREAVSTIASLLNAYVKPVMVSREELERIHSLSYRKIKSIQDYADSISVPKEQLEITELQELSGSSHISELAKLILRDACEIDASDIHIESTRDSLRVRLRVDGVLQAYQIYNKDVSKHLIRYFKLLSDIDITEENIPSEGKKVTLYVDEQEVHLRFSFMPTHYGQSVVIRLLNEVSTFSLDNKITDQACLTKIRSYLKRSYGMLLISGPTGSGKTTTLYGALGELNQADKKIITLEDPVEAHIPGLNQVQIDNAIHYDFSEGVRAALRQDPDVIMVGEVRDEETANMLVRAAITGHLVLATIHARNVTEIPVRLLDLNVDPYLLATALRLNISQSLAKRICPNCKEKSELTEIQKHFLDKNNLACSNEVSFHRGAGCHYCQQTGCVGREAIFECLTLTEEMIMLLAKNDIAAYLGAAKAMMKGETLLDKAFQLAMSGVISLDEVVRMEMR
jgi:MSHA biogenesis protein MshE